MSSYSDRIYQQGVVLPVPERTLAWAARQFGRGTRVVSVRRMFGGSSTAMHAVDVRTAGGKAHRLVLRRFIRPNWKYPGLPRREARVLDLLERERYPAPRLVAFDDGPRETDVRAVLMTRLSGSEELQPKRLDAWLRQMAEALPRIHAMPASSLRRYRSYSDQRDAAVPRRSRRPEAWAKAFDLARTQQPRTPPRFIHRDYHPGNILWSRGSLVGVVDWINACAGPPQVDVAHCRINLAWLHGVDVADAFLAAYASASGTNIADYDPYWDAIGLADSGAAILVALATMPEPAPGGLTFAKMRSRLDAFAVATARR